MLYNAPSLFSVFILLMLFCPAPAQSQQCDPVLARQLLNNYAKRVIESKLGSDSGNINIRTSSTDCLYSERYGYLIDARIAWQGAFSGDDFWADGRFSLLPNGDFCWANANANGNLLGWWAIRFGPNALNSKSIEIVNDGNRECFFSIAYEQIHEIFKTQGWYRVAPGGVTSIGDVTHNRRIYLFSNSGTGYGSTQPKSGHLARSTVQEAFTAIDCEKPVGTSAQEVWFAPARIRESDNTISVIGRCD